MTTARQPAWYPFPEELARIPRDRAAVIEASAGTGKTYLIEHMVVDRLIRGDARIEEMLVVTFTDRAAAELRRRIRALLARVRGHRGRREGAHGWIVDDAARARLAEAARALDGAPISTIHAFCQRILTERAFASGRLLLQQSVESRAAFAAAFAEVLRRRLAVDPALAPYLRGYLAAGSSVDALEQLLYQARQLRAEWGLVFDPAELARAGAAYARLSPAEIEKAVAAGVPNRGSAKAVQARLGALHQAARRFDRDGDPARFLAAIDILVKDKDLFDFVAERLGPAGADVAARVAELAEAAVPLDTVVAQKLGPAVAERLAARKRAAGLYDFDDMLLLVDEALGGPSGGELIASLRRRFKLAIVDEFQDTDPVQWRIFRAIFQPDGQAGSAANPLYLVGDPKQSIYGFRGADVATYATACAEIATPAEAHQLTRNFRSTAPVIDAYNAILDQEAEEPFFNAGGRYHPPVVFGGVEAAPPEQGAAAVVVAPQPAVTLLRVTAEEEVTRLPMRSVRDGLSRAVADEIASLLASPNPPPAREIFVLTRTWREAAAAATALGARGVPYVLYNQEGLYLSAEARHVRDLLRALADPHDRAKRLRAWLTPFFGLALGDLPAAAGADGDHPLFGRLFAWHDGATTQPLPQLYARILGDSGVVLRELFLGDSARRLTNYRHLFEVLAADAARAARPLGDVVRRLSALCEGLIVPAPEEGNVQRLESDRDAVQVMTMHKAKGLEADVVFLYGGYSPSPNRGVRSYLVDGKRLALAGPPRRKAVVELIKRERDGDDQRLYYVALTRARRSLYLPYSGIAPDGDVAIDASIREDLWRLNGGYRHVNRRLRAVAGGDEGRRHFTTRDVAIGRQAVDADEIPAERAAALRAWRPEIADLAPPQIDPELARLRHRRAGPALTSYSRIKHAEGGYRPPTEIPDEAAETRPAGDDQLPGGARAGIFLHDLLETTPLETLRETPDFERWAARPDVQARIEAALRRHGRDPRQAGASAQLVHAALTSPLPVVGGTLPGLVGAARVAREMEFLFPFPAAAGGADRGFVKGFVDVIFEHGGRAYFGDWKTDRLPAWDLTTVDAHVARNYALQEQLYALALLQMLGVGDEASYEARFGGTLYLFVRGMPGAVRSRRPSFAEIADWRDQIADKLGAQEAP